MRLRSGIAFIFLLATSLAAQTFRGTILGTVTDSSGAAIAGATVTVRNVNTGLERTAETGAEGNYSVSELPIGSYNVNISHSGFQTSQTNSVAVEVSAEKRVDMILKPGQVTQRVEVSADTLTQVETVSAELGGTLTAETIENLPVNGRDFTKLIYLNPGIAGSPDQISDSPGSYGLFSMNGSRGRSNNFLLDGTDMNDGYRNLSAINEAGVFGDPATILPLEGLAEVRVLSNYEAEYGRNSGAIINIVTKSGTNDWHGALLEYWRSGQVGARNYFNSDPNPKNSFLNNQFGGSLGGPIVWDKTFFYANYEGQRESGAQSGTSCVPDPVVIAATEQAITSGGGTLNPVTQALLARNPWPTPNITGASSDEAGCTDNNLSTATPFRNRVDSMIVKVDHNFNPSNLLTGRYFFGDSDQSFPFAQLAGGLLPGFNTVTPTRVQLVSLSYVKVINSSQINEARLGWNRYVQGFFPEDRGFDPASIGLNTGAGAYEGGLPAISVGGFSQIGATNGVPRDRVDTNWHVVDNYTWKTGRHDVKAGYEFRRTSIRQVFENTFRGNLTFDSLTDFLEGNPSDGSHRRGDTLRHTFQNNHGFFLQDSYRFSPRLTLNLGLRWDYYGVPSERNDLFFGFDPAGGGSTPQIKQLYDKDLNNFAPRLAFAYDLTGKGYTVIRGGWGMFYDAFSQDIFLGHLPWNCFFCPGPAYAGTGPTAPISLPLTGGSLDPNVPVYDLASGAPGGEFFGADPNIRTPYVQNFNLNLQQALGSKAVLQIGYVGSKGTRLFRFRDINQPSHAQITADDLANGVIEYGVTRPFSDPFYINMEESNASSNYHSLQTSLRMNSWHGVSTQANFVWSHAIDDASDSEDFSPNQAQPTDSTNPSRERGNSSFDIRRRFTWNFSYQLPNFGGGKLVKGWGIDGILTLQDGQPFHLNYLFEGDYSGSGEGFDRPDLIGPVHYGSAPNNFLDLSSFAAPCTWATLNDPTDATADNCVAGTRHFGSLGRNSLRGPSFKEFHFTVFKDTALSERINLHLSADFLNLFNHPNFANPIMPGFAVDIGNPDFLTGQHSGSLALTTTGDVGIGNPFLGGGGPRGIQFAAKITF